MDTETLKAELIQVVQAFEREGKPLDFAGIMPIAPSAYNTRYIFQVSSPFLKNGAEGLDAVIEKLFQFVSVEGRQLINSVQIYIPRSVSSVRLLYASDDLILVNRLNYKPDPLAYYEFMAAEN